MFILTVRRMVPSERTIPKQPASPCLTARPRLNLSPAAGIWERRILLEDLTKRTTGGACRHRPVRSRSVR